MYTLFSTKLADPFTLLFVCQQNNVLDHGELWRSHVICYCKRASHTSYARAICAPTGRRTFTLTRAGLLLRVDKYEPHNFRQFSTEQSIVADITDHLHSS